MNKSHTNTGLISQPHIGEYGKDWHLAVLNDLESRLTDPGFPCVFSLNAFRKQLLKFVFVENAEDTGIQHLGEGLGEYVELSKRWEGRLDTAYPLVVAFSLDAITAHSVEDYHAFGWKVLEDLHEIDPAPWPEAVAKDPESESWSMCFNGMPLFCNMSAPAHRIRRSRNLGEHFILIINPRERFDIFAGDTPRGRNTRANIRNRINRYDGVPYSSHLGSYGAGGLEWSQYGLAEDNSQRTGKCPATFRES
ncbi:MAG: YqcI/YcgG family protein [Jatrophihabitantaceae bacterium]